MEFEEIETDRLILKKITPEVYDFVFANYSEPEIMAFFNFTKKEDFEKDREKFEKGLSTHNRSFVYFQLIDKDSKKMIGWCGYHTWYLDHDRAEIFYVFKDDKFSGKGLMTEAMKVVINYGFNEMNLHRIEAFVSPENLPSLNLIQKVNFTKEGHLREHYLNNGKAEDSLVFSLLKWEIIERS